MIDGKTDDSPYIWECQYLPQKTVTREEYLNLSDEERKDLKEMLDQPLYFYSPWSKPHADLKGKFDFAFDYTFDGTTTDPTTATMNWTYPTHTGMDKFLFKPWANWENFTAKGDATWIDATS